MKITAQCIWIQSISSHSFSSLVRYLPQNHLSSHSNITVCSLVDLSMFTLIIKCYFVTHFVTYEYDIYIFPLSKNISFSSIIPSNSILLLLSVLWWIFFIHPLKEIYSFSILLCSLEVWPYGLYQLGSCQYRSETILGTLWKAISLAI